MQGWHNLIHFTHAACPPIEDKPHPVASLPWKLEVGREARNSEQVGDQCEVIPSGSLGHLDLYLTPPGTCELGHPSTEPTHLVSAFVRFLSFSLGVSVFITGLLFPGHSLPPTANPSTMGSKWSLNSLFPSQHQGIVRSPGNSRPDPVRTLGSESWKHYTTGWVRFSLSRQRS